jgi:hypothetical protein
MNGRTLVRHAGSAIALATAIGLSTLAMGESAQAAGITNGDFSSGFSGWDTLGNTAINGDPAAQLNVGGSEDASALETFLGLASGSLQAPPDGFSDLFGGSAIKQTFTAAAGDVVKFTWNFTTSDYLPFNDFAFTSLSSSLSTLSSVGALGNLNGSTSSSGPQTFSWIIPTAGTYTLGFGVINVGDNLDLGTTLAVDDVTATPVPTPALLPGLVAMGAAAWRKRKTAAQTEATDC